MFLLVVVRNTNELELSAMPIMGLYFRGRKPALQAGGRGFESHQVHHIKIKDSHSNYSFRINLAHLVERLAFNLDVVGSTPTIYSLMSLVYASVAQLVEQRTENPRVVGSIPTGGTTSVWRLKTHTTEDIEHGF